MLLTDNGLFPAWLNSVAYILEKPERELNPAVWRFYFDRGMTPAQAVNERHRLGLLGDETLVTLVTADEVLAGMRALLGEELSGGADFQSAAIGQTLTAWRRSMVGVIEAVDKARWIPVPGPIAAAYTRIRRDLDRAALDGDEAARARYAAAAAAIEAAYPDTALRVRAEADNQRARAQ